MNVRIEALVFSVNFIFLAAALAFFLLLSYQRLYPAVFSTRKQTALTLIIVSCSGIAGAWLYGLAGSVNAVESGGMPQSRLELPFGSFGGYWGVILAGLLVAAVMRQPPLRQTDALVPGILVGGAIARLADLFNKANSGIVIDLGLFPWFQPFKYWAIYDIAIHMLALMLVWRLSHRCKSLPGLALTLFLAGYGFMRFGIEFVRDTVHIFGPFTYGHIMAAAQVSAGIALLKWMRLNQPNPDGNHKVVEE